MFGENLPPHVAAESKRLADHVRIIHIVIKLILLFLICCTCEYFWI